MASRNPAVSDETSPLDDLDDSGIHVSNKEDGVTNFDSKSQIGETDRIETNTDSGEPEDKCSSLQKNNYSHIKPEMETDLSAHYEPAPLNINPIKQSQNHGTDNTVNEKLVKMDNDTCTIGREVTDKMSTRSHKEKSHPQESDMDPVSGSKDQKNASTTTVLPREHAALDYLLSQIPKRAQRGMLQHTDLVLTCISASESYIALGSNVGTVFLYNRRKQYMEKFRYEHSSGSVTSIKLHHGIDDQLAVGMSSGGVYILQIPANCTIGHSKQIQKFSVTDVHEHPVTCVEWSTNGMKLFSGDQKGVVVCTEVDSYQAQCKSVILLTENSQIVQLHYCHKVLLVSSKHRSAVCRIDLHDQLCQVGQKERKILGDFGACFKPGLCKTEDAQLYAVRPGCRLWKASVDGIVNSTYLYKDLLNSPHPEIYLLPSHSRPSISDGHHQFGRLMVYQECLLVTWNEGHLFLLNPDDNAVVGSQHSIGCLQDVCCTDDEIFILRKDSNRAVIRIAGKAETYTDLDHILHSFSQHSVVPDESHQENSKPSVFQTLGSNIFGKIHFKEKRTPSPIRKSTLPLTLNASKEFHPDNQDSSKTPKSEILPPVVKLSFPELLRIQVYNDDKVIGTQTQQQTSVDSVADSQYQRSVSSEIGVGLSKDRYSESSTGSENCPVSIESTLSGEVGLEYSREEKVLKSEDLPRVFTLNSSAPTIQTLDTETVPVPTIEEKLVEKLSKDNRAEDIVFSQRLKKAKKKKRPGKKDTDKVRQSKAEDMSEVVTARHTEDMGGVVATRHTEDSGGVVTTRHTEDTSEASEVVTTRHSYQLSPEIQTCQPGSLTKDCLSPLNSEGVPCRMQGSEPTNGALLQSSSEVLKTNDCQIDCTQGEEVHPLATVSLASLSSSESKTPDTVSVTLDDEFPSGIVDNHGNKDPLVSSVINPEFECSAVVTELEVVDSNKVETEEVASKVLYRSNSASLEAILRNFDDNEKEEEKCDNVKKNNKESGVSVPTTTSGTQLLSTPPRDKLSMLIEKTELDFTRSLNHQTIDGSMVDESNSAPESGRLLYKSPPSTSTLYKTPDSSSSGEDFYRRYRGESTCSSLVSSPDNPLSHQESDEDEEKPSGYLQEDKSAVQEPSTENLPPNRFINNWIEHSTHGNLYSLALSGTHVWVTDRSQNIYSSSLQGQALTWKKAVGLANQIAVSKSGNIIWRLHKNFAYAGTKITPKRPEGMKWVEAVRDCNYIALDENCAWYIKTNGEVLMQAGLSKDRPCYKSQRVVCPFHLQQLVCRSGVVWGLTQDCKLIFRSGITSENPVGNKWLLCKHSRQDLLFCHLALGDRKTGWAVDVVGQVWFVSGVTMETPLGDECWWQVPISEYYMQDVTAIDALRSLANKFDPQKLSYLLSTQRGGLLAVGALGVWMCPEYKNVLQVCRGTIEGHHWNEIQLKGLATSVAWKYVCAGTSSFDNGVMWIQQPNGDVFTFPTDTCKITSISRPSLNEQIKCLSVCKQAIWAVTESGKVYIRDSVWPHCPEGSSWVGLDLSQLGDVHLIHLSCGTLNIWAIDSEGDVFQRIGVKAPSSHSLNPAWLVVDSSPTGTVFTQVESGPQDWMVWAIDNRRHVFVRDGVTDTMPIGTKWMHVPGTPASKLTISNNYVWALTPSGEIMCRFGISHENPAGDYWKKIPGFFKHISVSHRDSLWAIGREGSLHHRQTKYIVRRDPMQDHVGDSSRCSTSSMGSEEGDWELV